MVLATGKSGCSGYAQGVSADYKAIETGKTGFAFESSNPQGSNIQKLGTANNIAGALPKSNATTLTGLIAWNEVAEQFQLTFSTNATNSEKVINLGSSFTTTSMVVTSFADTGTSGTLSDISLKVTSVPEPTTATLSLLALAGLAARRRRINKCS